MLLHKNEIKRVTWRDISIKDKWQLVTSSVMFTAAIALAFFSFIWLKVIGIDVIGMSGLFLSTGLALLGLSSYVKTSVAEIKTEVDKKIEQSLQNETEKIKQITDQEIEKNIQQ